MLALTTNIAAEFDVPAIVQHIYAALLKSLAPVDISQDN